MMAQPRTLGESMDNPLCRMFGIGVPIFAFSHCRDVVVEVFKAGTIDLHDATRWPEAKARLAAIFATRTRAEWCERLEGSDACFAPVLSPREAHEHAHNRARSTFIAPGGVLQPAPAPRFGGTPAAEPRPPHSDDAAAFGQLQRWGVAAAEIDALVASGRLRAGGPRR
jgi:alpha-methylacyl-CoA racemase